MFSSLIASLHESTRAVTRRLKNIRALCHSLESSSRLLAPATCTPLEIYQQYQIQVLAKTILRGEKPAEKWTYAQRKGCILDDSTINS